MNQEDLNAMMRNPWEAAKKPRPQPLPECPQCGERYCGDGIAFCTECANTVTPPSRGAVEEGLCRATSRGILQERFHPVLVYQ